MTETDFIAAMQRGLPPIQPPAAHRCECDPANHHVCDDCEAVGHALRQHGADDQCAT